MASRLKYKNSKKVKINVHKKFDILIRIIKTLNVALQICWSSNFQFFFYFYTPSFIWRCCTPFVTLFAAFTPRMNLYIAFQTKFWYGLIQLTCFYNIYFKIYYNVSLFLNWNFSLSTSMENADYNIIIKHTTVLWNRRKLQLSRITILNVSHLMTFYDVS